MADLVITPANVGIGANAQLITGVASEAITRGATVVQNPSTQKFDLANNGTPAGSIVKGIAQSESAADGDEIIVQVGGNIKPGATVTQSQLYYLSGTDGKIAPYGDLVTGDNVTSIFRAVSANEATMKIDVTGTEIP